ncbi:MAG: ATP-binding cassette domain-containing protein [Cellulomonadaceae bacterium]|jgi:ABC-type lipoprotein export system ATPase subunit|nr:ATP-binding cassette domain-containing protein [Cellulomonadaceae bacterium]
MATIEASTPINGVQITTDNLGFSYRRTSPEIISGIDYSFSPGSLTTLTGPSGCGKSTLLYLLSVLVSPTRGSVRWDDRDIERATDGEKSRLRAAWSGFVFQDALLDPARTVLDNVCESALFAGAEPQSARAKASILLERFGVLERSDHRPGEISGGQAQRVALCRALVTEPRVIFGDEPTGNLDPETSLLVWDALSSHARRGATVIIATHDPSLAATADVNIVMSAPQPVGMS